MGLASTLVQFQDAFDSTSSTYINFAAAAIVVSIITPATLVFAA
jgi:hypothetical protein